MYTQVMAADEGVYFCSALLVTGVQFNTMNTPPALNGVRHTKQNASDQGQRLLTKEELRSIFNSEIAE